MKSQNTTKPLQRALIQSSPYNWDIVCLKGGTAKQATDVVEREWGETDTLIYRDTAQGYTWMEKGKVIVVWAKDEYDISTITHELMHATFRIMEGRGVQYSRKGEEAYTYLFSSLVDQWFNPKLKWRRVK